MENTRDATKAGTLAGTGFLWMLRLPRWGNMPCAGGAVVMISRVLTGCFRSAGGLRRQQPAPHSHDTSK
jgi:hypothetical protein